MQVELDENDVIEVVNKFLDRADASAEIGKRFWDKYGPKLEAYYEAHAPKQGEIKPYDYDRDRAIGQIRQLKEGLAFASATNVAKQLRLLFLLDRVTTEISEDTGWREVTIKEICIGKTPRSYRDPEHEGYTKREQEYRESLR